MWIIAGCLSILASLLWLITGNIAMMLINTGAGLLFIMIGAVNSRKADKKENPISVKPDGNE
jgi:hypothetical protein